MRVLRISLAVLALAGLVAATGCGSTESTDSDTNTEALSADEYTQEAQDVLIAFGTSFQELGAKISAAKTTDEFTKQVDEAEGAIQDAIDEYSALQPPEEAQKGHDQVISALENFSSKLTDVSKAADSGDKSALKDAATALQSAGFEFQDQLLQAQQSYQDAGLEFGGGSADDTSEETTNGG